MGLSEHFRKNCTTLIRVDADLRSLWPCEIYSMIFSDSQALYSCSLWWLPVIESLWEAMNINGHLTLCISGTRSITEMLKPYSLLK